jgi:hypothetical protein
MAGAMDKGLGDLTLVEAPIVGDRDHVSSPAITVRCKRI